MANSRRFFRFDVMLKVYLQRQGTELKLTEQVLKSPQRVQLQQQVRSLDSMIGQLLEDMSNRGSKVYLLFFSINQRLNYFDWLLNELLEQRNPAQHPEFKFRSRDDLKHKSPEVKKESPTSLLVAGIYGEIDSALKSLKGAIEHVLDDRLFVFSQPIKKPFDSLLYVKNLESLVLREVPAAVMLDKLCRKYNLLNQLYNFLKQAYAPISSAQGWPKMEINLSAGGVAFLSAEKFSVLETVDVFMELNEIVLTRGKVLYSRQENSRQAVETHTTLYRTAIEFQMPSGSAQQQIQAFLQHEEVRQALEKVPAVTVWAF
ncbi:hypothetical protein THMIRHAS_21490 [Thiosulfatimonas sediminis]|uniref:PilZ domain-containing protein n=1 Tax=Thiosulfatimonas sediminis TaxID=2675054 RepID=A0A6F8PXF4_9GAMM|nr:hypothetical protein [Thiosulfatimonas sediminis]BBP46776.1 hypothetical protein THMIRHAS_21490 [Thiosulfatimonas sediminis]